MPSEGSTPSAETPGKSLPSSDQPSTQPGEQDESLIREAAEKGVEVCEACRQDAASLANEIWAELDDEQKANHPLPPAYQLVDEEQT